MTRLDRAVLAGFIATVVLFGVNFVAVRLSNRELAPFWGAGLRFLVAATLLGWVLALRGIPLPRGRALLGAVLFGALAFGANFALLYWALVRAGAGVSAIVFALVPLLTLLLAFVTGLERLGARAVAGALLALAGIGLAFRDQLALDVPLVSLLAVVGAALAAATSGIVVKRFPRAHPIGTNAVGMAVGAAILLGLSLLTRERPAFPTVPATWGALAWLVASSCVGFVLLVWVIARWTASAASYSAVLAPLVTIGVATALAGEALTPLAGAGGALVLAGAWLGTSRPRGAPADARTSSAPPVRAR